MIDLPRYLGGRRSGKKSAPLSIADQPGKHELILKGHYYGIKNKKNSLSTRGVKLNPLFCVRRYLEMAGKPCKNRLFRTLPHLVQSNPKVYFEVEGVCSFTDSNEALMASVCVNRPVIQHSRQYGSR